MLCGGVVPPDGARIIILGRCKIFQDLQGYFGHMSALHRKPRHPEVGGSRGHRFPDMACHGSFGPAFCRRCLGLITVFGVVIHCSFGVTCASDCCLLRFPM